MSAYYHTTRFADLAGIAAVGLLPREGSGLYDHGLYAAWSQDKVFAADADAALAWFGKIADLAEYHHGDDQEPDYLVPVMLRLDLDGFELHEDSLGQADVRDGRSVYVEAVVPPERIDYWQPGVGWTPITDHEQADVSDGVMDTEEFEDGTVAFQVYGPYDDGGFKPTDAELHEAQNIVERLRKTRAPTTDREARRQTLRQYALAGERGRYWYQRAEEEIRTVAQAWGVDPVYVAVAAAATSPATPVVSSDRMARGGGTASNIGKARRVVKRQALTGRGSDAIHPQSPGASRLLAYEACTAAGREAYACLEEAFPSPQTTKTHAFVRNLLGFEEPVTVDSLVGKVAGLPVKAGRVQLTDKRYREVAEDITAVARELGWPPREVMAAIWTAAGGSGDFAMATRAERRHRRS